KGAESLGFRGQLTLDFPTTTTTEEDTKVTAQSQEKKSPKISPILWLLIGCGLITVVFGGFYVRNKFLKK
ncbi:hypothetical protein, partial [Bacteroides intestinalis]|uniref:hypothetical protein n=1 Tax=Bacteroides intestinalis TaxID=329854 RepID=UPI0022E39074